MLLEHSALDGFERSPNNAQAEMLDALVAGEGLKRVARIAEERVGAAVGIFVPRPGSDGSDGSAAERFVADLVAGRPAEQPEEVGELVPIVAAGELAGAVVMLGEGSDQAIAYLRAAAVAAVTGVAMLNAREDAGRGSDEGLLADLVAGRELRPGEIARRARTRGCDLAEGVAAICLAPGEEPVGGPIATIAAECPGALVEVCGERLYVLVPGPLERARRLSERLSVAGRATTARSSHYRQAADAALAVEEAEMLLALAEAGGYADADDPAWDSLRLLFRGFAADPGEIARFSEERVGELIRHDESQGSELQSTFWAYQETNCNMNLTAKATYTHRHTVSNRLARIGELTGLDPVRGYDRELLSLALRAHYVVAHSRPR